MVNRKSILCISLLVIAITPIIALVSRSFSASVDEEVKSVTIQSNNYNEPGSWKLEKSAKWLEKNKAEITLNLKTVENNNGNNKDVILIYDDSGSMHGEKMRYAREGSQAVISSILDNPDNRVALILSDSGATIVSDFTNDKVTLNNDLENAIASGYTNYYHALVRVDELLQGYTKEANRDVVLVFIVSCFPFYDSPNEAWKYETLKQKYPYLTINAIQYEMGASGTEEVISMSDRQWIADRNNIQEAIYEASLTTKEYEELKIEDYINNDFYNLDSISDIKVDKGEVNVSEEDSLQKVTWNLSNILTGESAKLTINVNLKDEYKELDGLYSTNNKEIITSKINGKEAKSITSELTPKLSNKYYLTYSPNTPEGCNLGGVTVQEYFAYDTVNKRTDELTCEGYLFRGWEVDLNDVSDITIINSDTFIMPGHNVTIRAIWTKQDVNKKMNGTVRENENTLYRVLQDAALDGTYAKEYTGAHQDSFTQEANKPIYHWYAENDTIGNKIPNMYNVKFAGRCWRMIRTTDIGGVRLLYNGIYDDEKKCTNGRNKKDELVYQRMNIGLYGGEYSYGYPYAYGTGYTYNETTKKFNLTGDIEVVTGTVDNYEQLIGKYTCRNSYGTDCSEINEVIGLDSGNQLMAVNITPTDYYNTSYTSIIGYGPFDYGEIKNTLGGMGYMTGDMSETVSFSTGKKYQYSGSEGLLIKSGESNQAVSFELQPSSSEGYYKLKNPIKISTFTNRKDMKGMYINYEFSDFEAPDRILEVDDNGYLYYITETWSQEDKLTIGNSYISNGDGTYTLTDTQQVDLITLSRNYNRYNGKIICPEYGSTCKEPRLISRISASTASWADMTFYELYYSDAVKQIRVAKNREGYTLKNSITVDYEEFINNHDDYKDYIYTCGDLRESCSEDDFVITTTIGGYYYQFEGNRNYYYYGSDVTWDGTKYTLVDPVEFEVYQDNDLFSSHHYVCLTPHTLQCEKIGFAIYYNGNASVVTLVMKNGEKDIVKLIDNVLRKNENDSFIKIIVEKWYEKYMTKYTSYLEDTIYCNNRSPMDEDTSFNGPNGNIRNPIDINTKFMYYSDFSPDLSCRQDTDKFSVSNPKAKQKYPVNLLTSHEMALFNNNQAREVAESFYTGTRTAYNGNNGTTVIATYYGSSYGSSYYPIVPAISLKYGTQYISGTGTTEDPYVVDTSEVDEP